jgi:hypothetical protein
MANQRGIETDLLRPRGEIAAAVQPELADRLLFRLFGAVADQARAGERLQLSVDQSGDRVRISVSRPEALRRLADSDLFEVAPGGDGQHAGFSLRLARGLARIAGGDLVSSRDAFTLVFPRA